jgi:hypothetical protein
MSIAATKGPRCRPPPASPKSTYPRAFSLLKITGQVPKLSKKLFEEQTCLPIFYQNYTRHRRVSSTIVKNTEHSYDFCNAIQSDPGHPGDSDADVSVISAFSGVEEQPQPHPKCHFGFDDSHRRNSMFASTAQTRGNSAYESSKEPQISTIYTLSSETPSRPATQKTYETDPDFLPYDGPHVGNTTTLGVLRPPDAINEVELFQHSSRFKYEHKVRSSSLGLLPTLTYCFHCNSQVVTDVSMHMPKVSLWRTMCCVGDLLKDCSDTSGWRNFQVFQHHCSHCRSLLGAVNPASIR